MIKNLLPIGSVVLLKGGKKRVMIFGIKQINQEETQTEYDYIAVPYPEGNVGTDTQYLFNHSDVDKVFFRGYEDDEREEFVLVLERLYAAGNIE